MIASIHALREGGVTSGHDGPGNSHSPHPICAIRDAVGSEASRVPLRISKSHADIALRSLPPAFGGRRFRIDPLDTVFHGL